MKIVIDIPEDSYKATCDGCMLPPDVRSVVHGIKNGVPLPKSHEKIIDSIDFAIKATNSQDDYSMGMRNGMRYVKYLIDGKEPQYESRRTDEEIKLGIDLGDEVVSDYGAKGVVVGIDTCNGEVLLSLLMRNHKVPQLVKASAYKTKTGRHFSQIIEVFDQMKGEADGK